MGYNMPLLMLNPFQWIIEIQIIMTKPMDQLGDTIKLFYVVYKVYECALNNQD